MSKKVIVGPGENNQTAEDLTSSEITEMETRISNLDSAFAAVKTNAESGNQKFLDMGLTQAEVTAMTGYKPE